MIDAGVKSSEYTAKVASPFRPFIPLFNLLITFVMTFTLT